MAASARTVYVVADHSKLGVPALMRYGNVAEWEGLITDDVGNQTITAALRRAGVRIIHP